MALNNRLKRFFSEPLVLLVLIGGAIYGGYRYLEAREESQEEARIHLNAEQIEGMAAQWTKRWNRPPTREEMNGLIEKYVRDELLYRQGMAMGLHENDPVIRQRTAQKLEMLIGELAAARQPTDAELKQYFQENEADYREQSQFTFTQVFFNPDTRKDATLEDAKAALADLEAAGEPDPETLEAGDRLMLQNHFSSASEAEVRRQMGSGFAAAILELEPGRWHGPVQSGFGVHLVYLHELKEGAVPPWDTLKDKVQVDWEDQNREEFSAQFLGELREGFEIVIDEVPDELLIIPPGQKPDEAKPGESDSSNS